MRDWAYNPHTHTLWCLSRRSSIRVLSKLSERLRFSGGTICLLAMILIIMSAQTNLSYDL